MGLWYLAAWEQQDGRGVRRVVRRKEKEEMKWFTSRQYYSFLSCSSGSCRSFTPLVLSSVPLLSGLHVFVVCPPRLWCVRCLTNLINCVWPTAQIFVENTLRRVFIAVPLYHPVATTKQECRNEITEKSNGQYLWPQRGNNYSREYIVPIQGCVAFDLKMWQSRDMIDCTDSP